MNSGLRNQIIQHVFANLAVFESDYVNYAKSKSLMSQEFLLKDTLSQKDEAGNIIKNSIWGCQISSADQELKLILANCSLEPEVPEFALLIQLKNSPAWGVFLDVECQVPMLAVSLDGKAWMEATTYLQATFLAAMESMKETNLAWHKSEKHHNQIDLLKSFLRFHEAFYEG